MGRHKGGNNRRWSDEERLKYVLLCEEEHFAVNYISREYDIPRGTLRGWINRYRNGGISSLNPQKMRTGNHFAALHSSDSLSDLDRLKLIVEKLEIENERLKKGYIVKGAGAAKEYVTLKDVNSK